MEVSLAGKVALITGASRGIGQAIAGTMAAAGASVMLTSRKQNTLEDSAAEIFSGRWGAVRADQLAVHAANAGDVAAGQACVAATIERFGGLDILVNNAATNPYYGPTLGIDEGRYDKTFQVNLRGPLFWIQAAWEQALRDHPGVIVNIASVGGLRAEGSLGVYNLTKAALIHMTRQLGAELGPTRVVGVAPGLVDTEFASVLVENFGEALAKRVPTGRIGQPEDIANLVTFLASDKASWISCETFVIDGGAINAAGSI